MPIVYIEKEMQTLDQETNVSLFQFSQHREHHYFLLTHENKKFMVSTTFSSKERLGASKNSRKHTYHIDGFSHVESKDITRTYDKDLDIWVNRHAGLYVRANHENYKDIIVSHLLILMRYGHSESEWPHETIVDFSRLDESRKAQGIAHL